MIQDETEEYREEVLECALALKALKDCDKIRGLSIVAENDNLEFVEDINIVYKALLADEEAAEKEKAATEAETEAETDDEDDILEAITFTLKLLSAATAKLIETQIVHDKAIKVLLEGKL